MDWLLFFKANMGWFIFAVAIIGAMVGSFLNVVIYRLPKMLEQDWRLQCHEFLNLPLDESQRVTFNLNFPGSHCPNCHAPIKVWYNIPLLGYLFLRGRAACCGQRISVRYPLIELLTLVLSAVVAYRFGVSLLTPAALLLTWSLIALAFIDWDTQLLPDSITLPFLWLGLLVNMLPLFTHLADAVLGGAVGYLVLWIITWIFKRLTGKTGMGNGDFKLLAMLGAWLGWQLLPFIILLGSLLGSIVGIFLLLRHRQQSTQPIAFGPYLAIAGFIALIWGTDIIRFYLGVAF